MFLIKPGWYWERRRVSQADQRKLTQASPRSERLAGPLPPLPELLRLPPDRRVTWGVELGRRFRDELRAAGKAGVPPASWPLDAIQAQAAGTRGRQYRALPRGVLRGLA